MKAVIFKYPVPGLAEFIAPAGKVVLYAQQAGEPFGTLWIEQQSTGQCPYSVVATGEHYDPDEWEHVGSCMCNNYVWHIIRKPA